MWTSTLLFTIISKNKAINDYDKNKKNWFISKNLNL